MNTHCNRCGRPLSDRYSREIGYGPICRQFVAASPEEDPEGSTQYHDLPFDPQTRAIKCERMGPRMSLTGAILHFNLRRRIIHHSPSGWEWGYAGSGPADFALAIMDYFLPLKKGGGRVQLWKGHCSVEAWSLHQEFKREFIALLSDEGGTIEGSVIQEWIRRQLEDKDNGK